MKGRIISVVAGIAIAIAAVSIPKHEGVTYKAIIPVPGDPPTICHGHTKGVKLGDTATQAQCDAWLKEDLAEANEIVERCIPGPKTIAQQAAMVSFAFNVGGGRKGTPPNYTDGRDGLCINRRGNPSYISRMAAQGNWQAACDGLLQFRSAGGVAYRGLVRRREDERKLCLSDYFSNVQSGSIWRGQND